MNAYLYIIWDSAAEDRAGMIMLFPNDVAAIRAMSETVADQKHIQRNAKDYSLVRIGTWSSAADGMKPGIVATEWTPVARATDFITKEA